MLQLIYASSANPTLGVIDVEPILYASQEYNARDSIDAILYFDGKRFLQLIEGPAASVDKCMRRIRRDLRHQDIVELLRKRISAREFEGQPITYYDTAPEADSFVALVEAKLGAPTPIARAAFKHFMRNRKPS